MAIYNLYTPTTVVDFCQLRVPHYLYVRNVRKLWTSFKYCHQTALAKEVQLVCAWMYLWLSALNHTLCETLFISGNGSSSTQRRQGASSSLDPTQSVVRDFISFRGFGAIPNLLKICSTSIVCPFTPRRSHYRP